MQNYIPDLANIIKNYNDEEFVIECVGILGNLNVPDMDYSVMLKEYDLLAYIKSKLIPGMLIAYLLSSWIEAVPNKSRYILYWRSFTGHIPSGIRFGFFRALESHLNVVSYFDFMYFTCRSC